MEGMRDGEPDGSVEGSKDGTEDSDGDSVPKLDGPLEGNAEEAFVLVSVSAS
jgi:hypothetical protein